MMMLMIVLHVVSMKIVVSQNACSARDGATQVSISLSSRRPQPEQSSRHFHAVDVVAPAALVRARTTRTATGLLPFDEQVLLAIGITSTAERIGMRDGQRATWLAKLPADVKAHFILRGANLPEAARIAAADEAARHGDVLFCHRERESEPCDGTAQQRLSLATLRLAPLSAHAIRRQGGGRRVAQSLPPWRLCSDRTSFLGLASRMRRTLARLRRIIGTSEVMAARSAIVRSRAQCRAHSSSSSSTRTIAHPPPLHRHWSALSIL